MSTACSTTRRGWPLVRVLFALAGTVTLLSAAHGPVGRLGRRTATHLLGKWAWWLPKPLDRVLPDVRFGHA